MFMYFLLFGSAFGIVFIFTRKKWTKKKLFTSGNRYFSRYFKKNPPAVTEAAPKIPIESADSAAINCPAAVLGDEADKPNLDKTECKELRAAMEKADLAFEKSDLDAAEKNYVKVLCFDENNLEANLCLGLIYLKKGLAAKAEAIYKKMIGLKCADAVIYSNLGNALYQQQKFTEACDAYSKAVELDPQNPKRFMNLGRILHEMGNFDSAIEYINKAISLDENAEYNAAMADVYISLKNLDRAREFIDRAFKIDKKNPVVKIVSKKLKAKRKNYKPT